MSSTTNSVPPQSGQSTGPSALRTVLLVVGSIAIAVLLALTAVRVSYALTGEDSSGSFEIADKVDSIEMRTSASDVVIGYRDVALPTLEFHQGAEDSGVSFEHAVVGSTLRVTIQQRGWLPWGFGSGGSTLQLTLPESLRSSAISLDLDSTAGDVVVDGRYGAVAVEATAGDVRLSGGADALNVQTTAGDVRVEDFTLRGELTGESTAGDVSYSFSEIPERVSIDSTAGNISFTVPDGSYRIVTETTAGDVDTRVASDFDSDRIFEFRTTAGDVRITNP